MAETTKLTPKPQVRMSAPDYVIGQIKEALIDGSLKPGDRVPAESELEALYGVSRGSIRQAMKSLETLGVLSIRPGDGTYINDGLSKNSFNSLVFALLLSSPSADSIVDARCALERDIIELVVNSEALSEKVLPLLRENLEHHRELLENGADISALVDNDLAFHRLLSSNCGNPVFAIVYDYVMEAFQSLLMKTTSMQDSGVENPTLRDHIGIFHAIEQKNYAEAKKAVMAAAETWRTLMA